MTLWPFLLIKHDRDLEDAIFMNHESIHAVQQKELGVLFFYIWYGVEYVFLFLKKWDHHKAYRSIVFEKEAYQMEKDLSYLKMRKFWGFVQLYTKTGN